MAKKKGNKKHHGKNKNSNGQNDNNDGDDFDFDNIQELKKSSFSSGNNVDVESIAKICAAVAFLLYSNSLLCEFPYDDGPAVRLNRDVLDQRGDGRMSPFADIWHHDFWGTDLDDPHTHKSYRPLVIASFRLDAMVSSGAWIFHLSNTLLYVLTCWVTVQVLANALPSDVDAPVKNKYLVLLVVCLWFVGHPIHTEAVAQIVGRAEILAGLFCIVAQKVYFSNIVGAIICLGAACLCKETAVVMPIVLGVADLIAALLAPSTTKGKPSLAGALFRAACMGCVSAGYISFRAALFANTNAMGISNLKLFDNFLQHLQPFDKLRTALFIQARYFLLLVWPFSKLSCDYSLGVIPIVSSWVSFEIVTVVFVVCIVLAWAIMGLVRVHKTGDVTLLLAFGWTFAPLIPASHIVDIGTVLAERLLFMPSVGVAMLLCQLVGMHAKKIHNLSSSNLGIILTGIVAWQGLKTLARVPQWTNSESLYKADIMAYPGSLKLNYMIGKGASRKIASEAGIFNAAKTAYEITQNNKHLLTKGPYTIGLAQMAASKTRTQKWPEGANLTEALEYVDMLLEPGIENVAEPYDILSTKATALMRKGHPNKDMDLLNEAADIFKTAVEYDTMDKAHYGLYCEYAMTLALLKQQESAHENFKKCFERHKHIGSEEEVEFIHVQNYGILMRELSGVVANDANAAQKYGADALDAVKAILSHSNLRPADSDKWQRVQYAIELLIASAQPT